MWFILGFAIFIGIVWIIAMKLFPHHITWKEGLLMLGVQSVIMGAVYFGSMYGKGYDVQIINGQVTSKYSEQVSCSHSYSCNCRQTCSGSGKNKTCSQTCSTCYEHSYDVDWIVKADVGYSEIDRVDRRGLGEPERWTAAYVGQPFAESSSYYNYIKASPFSIFNKSQVNAEVEVPEYPQIYDYYKVNRVIDFKSKFSHDNRLNELLNNELKTLGPEKKANVVIVFHSLGDFFVDAYKSKGLGGKINDVTILINVDESGEFKGLNVYSWSKEDIVNVKIRDALLDIGKYDPEAMTKAISSNIKAHYIHRSIKEFEYLDNEVELPDWAVWFLLIFGTLFPFGSSFVARKYELLD